MTPIPTRRASRSPWVRVAILLALTVTVVAAEQQARGAAPVSVPTAGAIGGTLVIDGTETPGRCATVTLQGGAFPNGQIAITDDHGRFVFAGLVAGRYTVSASKPTYVPTYFGSRRPGRGPGLPIALVDGQRVTDLALTLLPGAVIAGTTVDDRGRPRSGSSLVLLEMRTVHGDRTLSAVASTRSDDGGVYRFAGLAPGTYAVAATAALNFSGARIPTPQELAAVDHPLDQGFSAASPSAGGHPQPSHPIAYAPTLYPATTDPAAAQPVTVGVGEERSAIDIALQVVPSARLDGRVVDPDGQVPRALQLSLISPAQRLGFVERDTSGTLRPNAVVPTQAGGFVRPALTPGHYTFVARAADGTATASGTPDRPEQDLWAIADVDIRGEDVPDFVITLQRGMTVSGQVVLAASHASVPPDPSTVELRLAAATSGLTLGVPATRVNADGTFRFHGIVPGEYTLWASAGTGWALKTATLGTQDLVDTPLVVVPGRDLSDVIVTVDDRPTSISGTLVDALGRPAPEYVVVVFSADRRFWTSSSRRTRQMHPATDGWYTAIGLPAGEYLVAAVTDVGESDVDDPGFLELLSAAATRVSVTDGQAKTLNLRMANGGR
jgi:uncharacterized protein (DUF2141 family)